MNQLGPVNVKSLNFLSLCCKSFSTCNWIDIWEWKTVKVKATARWHLNFSWAQEHLNIDLLLWNRNCHILNIKWQHIHTRMCTQTKILKKHMVFYADLLRLRYERGMTVRVRAWLCICSSKNHLFSQLTILPTKHNTIQSLAYPVFAQKERWTEMTIFP